jgi:hypothetical protein
VARGRIFPKDGVIGQRTAAFERFSSEPFEGILGTPNFRRFRTIYEGFEISHWEEVSATMGAS